MTMVAANQITSSAVIVGNFLGERKSINASTELIIPLLAANSSLMFGKRSIEPSALPMAGYIRDDEH